MTCGLHGCEEAKIWKITKLLQACVDFVGRLLSGLDDPDARSRTAMRVLRSDFLQNLHCIAPIATEIKDTLSQFCEQDTQVPHFTQPDDYTLGDPEGMATEFNDALHADYRLIYA